jgi:hypothetical protein
MGKKFTGMGVEGTRATRLRNRRECIEESVTPGCQPIALAINSANTGPPASQTFAVRQYGVATTILGASPTADEGQSHRYTQKILLRAWRVRDPVHCQGPSTSVRRQISTLQAASRSAPAVCQ